MFAVFNRFNPAYEEAARDLGATPWQAFAHVVLPLIAPSVVGIGMFGFTLSWDEIARTSQAIGDVNTLPLELQGLTTTVTTPAIYALGTVTTVVSLVVIASALGSAWWLRRRRGRPGRLSAGAGHAAPARRQPEHLGGGERQAAAARGRGGRQPARRRCGWRRRASAPATSATSRASRSPHHAALDAVAARPRGARPGRCGAARLLRRSRHRGPARAHRAAGGRPGRSSLREAARFGRFAIVTGGAAWKPMLERIARGARLGRAAGARRGPSGQRRAARRRARRAVRELTEACRRAAVGVDAVVLGGAGLAGLAPRIAPALALPLIDSVTAGSVALLAAAGAQAMPVGGPAGGSGRMAGPVAAVVAPPRRRRVSPAGDRPGSRSARACRRSRSRERHAARPPPTLPSRQQEGAHASANARGQGLRSSSSRWRAFPFARRSTSARTATASRCSNRPVPGSGRAAAACWCCRTDAWRRWRWPTSASASASDVPKVGRVLGRTPLPSSDVARKPN